MANDAFRIGEFASRHGVTSTTLRYYERLGLLDPPVRTPAGYRVYGADADARLRFVLRVKRLGLALEEIGDVVRAGEAAGEQGARLRLRQLLAEKAGHARRQAREIKDFADHLAHVYEQLGEPSSGEVAGSDSPEDAPAGFDASLDAELARIET